MYPNIIWHTVQGAKHQNCTRSRRSKGVASSYPPKTFLEEVVFLVGVAYRIVKLIHHFNVHKKYTLDTLMLCINLISVWYKGTIQEHSISITP